MPSRTVSRASLGRALVATAPVHERGVLDPDLCVLDRRLDEHRPPDVATAARVEAHAHPGRGVARARTPLGLLPLDEPEGPAGRGHHAGEDVGEALVTRTEER